jgi:hypothetical protein
LVLSAHLSKIVFPEDHTVVLEDGVTMSHKYAPWNHTAISMLRLQRPLN